MEESTGLFGAIQAMIHNTLGEELWGIPMTPLVVCAFICGAMLFYLVMIRQVRKDQSEINES